MSGVKVGLIIQDSNGKGAIEKDEMKSLILFEMFNFK